MKDNKQMWSRLIDTKVGFCAIEKYATNKDCFYHNFDHILDCYQYLAANNVPYSEPLDYAVLHHDIVYDDQPKKEARSADWMLNLYPDQTQAAEIIMATEDHRITPRSFDDQVHMIKADLHGLTQPIVALQNFIKIQKEAYYLYGIGEMQFAQNTIAFLQQLANTVTENNTVDFDPWFWESAYKGIQLSINTAKGVLKFHGAD